VISKTSQQSVHHFVTDFTDHTKSEAPGASADRPAKGAVIGATAEFLDGTVTREALKSLKLQQPLRDFLDEQMSNEAFQTRRELLKGLGWQSLRDWYRLNLHTESDEEGNETTEAWWAPVRTEDLKKVKHLRIEWGGWEVDTLDVLLIGSETHGPEDRVWHGAALSNLQFDRTECTLRLVTDTEHLKEIADFMDGLEQKGGSWRTFDSASVIGSGAIHEVARSGIFAEAPTSELSEVKDSRQALEPKEYV
jgi:hypothetical protein